MSKHDQNSAAEVLYGVFNAPYTDCIGNISGRTHYEKLPEILIEDQLGRDTTIGTRQHYGEGMLAFGKAATKALDLAPVRFPFNESPVPCHQLGPNLLR